MKKNINAASALVLCTLIFPGISICQEMTFQEIEKELRVLKNRIDNLENELKRKDIKIHLTN